MRLYRLHIAPDEGMGEGEDCDEWFTSLTAAKRRRAEVIRLDPTMASCLYRQDYKIERYTINRPVTVALLLAALNRKAWADDIEEVVPDYVPPQHVDKRID